MEAPRLEDVGGVMGDRHPHVGGIGVAKACRRDADHGQRPPVQEDCPPDRVGPAAEPALPESVADDGEVVGAGLVIALGEVPARHGRDAEDAEEVGAHQRAGEPLRLAASPPG